MGRGQRDHGADPGGVQQVRPGQQGLGHHPADGVAHQHHRVRRRESGNGKRQPTSSNGFSNRDVKSAHLPLVLSLLVEPQDVVDALCEVFGLGLQGATCQTEEGDVMLLGP